MNEYTWADAGGGLFQRRLLSNEAGLATAALNDGFTGIFFGCTIQADFDLIVDAIGEGWTAMRRRHPQIAVELVQGEEWTAEYRNLNEGHCQIWLDRSFCVYKEQSKSSLLDLVRSDEERLTSTKGNYGAHLHVAPGNSLNQYHLVVSAQHSLFDAGGVLLVLDHLLQYLVNPRNKKTTADEAANLQEALPFMSGLRKVGDKVDQIKVQSVLDHSRELAEESKIRAYLPCANSSAENIRPNGLHLSSVPVANIVQAARKNKTSVSAAVLVAFALANLVFAENTGEATKSRIDLTVDARSLLSRERAEEATISATTMAPVILDARVLNKIKSAFGETSEIAPEFWSLSRQAKTAFEASKTGEGLEAIKYSHEIGKSPQPWETYPTICWPSVLGILKLSPRYNEADRTINVSEPICTVKNGPGSIISHIWTFKGELHIIHNYDTRSFTEKLIKEIARYIDLILGAIRP